jgi:chemotaxis signal transduction protein
MTAQDPGPLGSLTAEALHRSFDETFARSPAEATGGHNGFLSIRVGEDGFALRVSEIAGIETGNRILALPVERPGLLGIAGIRGRVVPVYSLAKLLGCREAGPEPHWLALVGHDPMGLAFSDFEGYLRVPRQELNTLGEAREHPYAMEALRHAGGVRPVLNIPRIIAAIERTAARPNPAEE